MIKNNEVNRYLFHKYHPQMADGHPFVPYTREEAITIMKKKTTVANHYNSGPVMFTFKDNFYLQDTTYGTVTKNVEMELALYGDFDPWSDDPPFEDGYDVMRWLDVKNLIDIFHQVINLEIEFKDYSFHLMYDDRYWKKEYKITLKNNDTHYIRGSLAVNPNVYTTNMYFRTANKPPKYLIQIGYTEDPGKSDVYVENILYIEKIFTGDD